MLRVRWRVAIFVDWGKPQLPELLSCHRHAQSS
jgi:hypothetical protein